MSRRAFPALAPLETLHEAKRGAVLPLPPGLARLYGRLRMPGARTRPHVFSNFATTLDGVVSLNVKGHKSGGDISGFGPALIVTTAAGARELRKQRVPDSVEIRAVRSRRRSIRARSVLDEVSRASAGKLILVEGGPQLLGTFYAERLLDEQFLTLSPQLAGRDADVERISLVMGQAFAPRHPLWGTLSDLRRGASHLFLRYSFP